MRSDVETLSSALESMRKEVNQALLDLIEDEIAAGAFQFFSCKIGNLGIVIAISV